MTRPRLAVVAVVALLAAACEEQPAEPQAAAPEPQAAGSKSGGGAGEVATGGGGGDSPSQAQTLEGRYQRALDLVRKKDWDAAYQELSDIAERGAGRPVGGQAGEQLKTVTANLLATPPTPTSSVIAKPDAFAERPVTLRGAFQNAGAVGASTYYFWLKESRTLQCRYARLPLADKERILKLKDGARVWVRGVVKPAWGTNPDPYVDLTLFRPE